VNIITSMGVSYTETYRSTTYTFVVLPVLDILKVMLTVGLEAGFKISNDGQFYKVFISNFSYKLHGCDSNS